MNVEPLYLEGISMAEHTKLPWTWHRTNCGPKIWEEHSQGSSVCQFYPRHDIERQEYLNAEANAAFIVKACNSHEALVKALMEIAYPIRAMQDRLQSGEKLDGLAAVAVANNAEYLRSIALKGLAALSLSAADGGGVK